MKPDVDMAYWLRRYLLCKSLNDAEGIKWYRETIREQRRVVSLFD